jgi:hypothetical protein
LEAASVEGGDLEVILILTVKYNLF